MMATQISASLVKELRERTGAGMMDCKNALELSSGDLERAVEELRKSGRTKADKKAGRIAAEGAIGIAESGNQAAMAEINSETDFVARDSHFISFLQAVAKTALQSKTSELDAFSKLSLQEYAGKTVEEARHELVAKVGENVQIRRLILSNPAAAATGIYIHGNRIGVIVELDIDNKELAKDIAMHIAASKPKVIHSAEVPADVIAKEKEIFMAQAQQSGKPEAIIEKMIAGRMSKFVDEVSLMGQVFIRDPNITVGALLKKANVQVTRFIRFEVGEGIEKKSDNFVEEVMAQVRTTH